MATFVHVVPFFVPSVQMAIFYIGLNGLITLILAINVVRMRGRTGVNLGEGGSEALQRAIRVHGNNIEYVPITLLTILGVGLLGASVLWIDVLGLALTAGRVLHALGLNASSGRSFGRAAGSLLTWLALLAGAIGAMLYGMAALPTVPLPGL